MSSNGYGDMHWNALRGRWLGWDDERADAFSDWLFDSLGFATTNISYCPGVMGSVTVCPDIIEVLQGAWFNSGLDRFEFEHLTSPNMTSNEFSYTCGDCGRMVHFVHMFCQVHMIAILCVGQPQVHQEVALPFLGHVFPDYWRNADLQQKDAWYYMRCFNTPSIAVSTVQFATLHYARHSHWTIVWSRYT